MNIENTYANLISTTLKTTQVKKSQSRFDSPTDRNPWIERDNVIVIQKLNGSPRMDRLKKIT